MPPWPVKRSCFKRKISPLIKGFHFSLSFFALWGKNWKGCLKRVRWNINHEGKLYKNIFIITQLWISNLGYKFFTVENDQNIWIFSSKRYLHFWDCVLLQVSLHKAFKKSLYSKVIEFFVAWKKFLFPRKFQAILTFIRPCVSTACNEHGERFKKKKRRRRRKRNENQKGKFMHHTYFI